MDEDRIGFAVLMLAFAALLLISAGLMRLTRKPFLFLRLERMKVRDKEEFAVQASKAIALCAAAPGSGAVISFLWDVGIGAVIMGIVFVVCMIFSVRFFKDTF